MIWRKYWRKWKKEMKENVLATTSVKMCVCISLFISYFRFEGSSLFWFFGVFTLIHADGKFLLLGKWTFLSISSGSTVGVYGHDHVCRWVDQISGIYKCCFRFFLNKTKWSETKTPTWQTNSTLGLITTSLKSEIQ